MLSSIIDLRVVEGLEMGAIDMFCRTSIELCMQTSLVLVEVSGYTYMTH